MSRGPGRWERAILEALERVPAFYLTDLLPEPHTRSHTVALNRAARKLADAHKIESMAWMCSATTGRITIYRPGYPSPTREQITRLKVASRRGQIGRASCRERG